MARCLSQRLHNVSLSHLDDIVAHVVDIGDDAREVGVSVVQSSRRSLELDFQNHVSEVGHVLVAVHVLELAQLLGKRNKVDRAVDL